MTPEQGVQQLALGGDNFAIPRAGTIISLFCGIWLFVSPWVYGAAGNGNAWNSWIVGAVIFLIALYRVTRPERIRAMSWVNVVLGAWVFFSPWIYGYVANGNRFINSLCVGAIAFVASIVAATYGPRRASAAPTA